MAPTDQQPIDIRIADIRKGAATIELVLPFLPPAMRDQYRELADGLIVAIGEIDLLRQDERTDEAAEAADDAWRLFRDENPARAVVARVLDVVDPLVSPILPAQTLVEQMAAMTVALGGVAYDLWKARILRIPFSPAVQLLVLRDREFSDAVLEQAPKLRAAFADEIDQEGPPFARGLVERYMTEGSLLDDADDERVKAAETEFRRALEQTLALRIDSEIGDMPELAGLHMSVGYGDLVGAIDEARRDKRGREAIDALVVLFEALHRGGGKLRSVLDKVMKELEAASS